MAVEAPFLIYIVSYLSLTAFTVSFIQQRTSTVEDEEHPLTCLLERKLIFNFFQKKTLSFPIGLSIKKSGVFGEEKYSENQGTLERK